ncbi:hypothetical protein [Mycobacterium sp.]|uniref:hypothetical protein n=1 Tax=Mycobacterium sp. TaxID=1785 RepID=UPI0025DD18F8|nr:hypothetical protein [Mycobacterium sp.]
MLFRLAEFLLVLLPLAGLIMTAVKGFSAHHRRIEQTRYPSRPVGVTHASIERRVFGAI